MSRVNSVGSKQLIDPAMPEPESETARKIAELFKVNQIPLRARKVLQRTPSAENLSKISDNASASPKNDADQRDKDASDATSKRRMSVPTTKLPSSDCVNEHVPHSANNTKLRLSKRPPIVPRLPIDTTTPRPRARRSVSSNAPSDSVTIETNREEQQLQDMESPAKSQSSDKTTTKQLSSAKGGATEQGTGRREQGAENLTCSPLNGTQQTNENTERKSATKENDLVNEPCEQIKAASNGENPVTDVNTKPQPETTQQPRNDNNYSKPTTIAESQSDEETICNFMREKLIKAKKNIERICNEKSELQKSLQAEIDQLKRENEAMKAKERFRHNGKISESGSSETSIHRCCCCVSLQDSIVSQIRPEIRLLQELNSCLLRAVALRDLKEPFPVALVGNSLLAPEDTNPVAELRTANNRITTLEMTVEKLQQNVQKLSSVVHRNHFHAGIETEENKIFKHLKKDLATSASNLNRQNESASIENYCRMCHCRSNDATQTDVFDHCDTEGKCINAKEMLYTEHAANGIVAAAGSSSGDLHNQTTQESIDDYKPVNSNRDSANQEPRRPEDIHQGMNVRFSGRNGKFQQGVVKWIGTLPGRTELCCGLELDSKCSIHNGVYQGKRYFQCKPNRGAFVPFSKIAEAWTSLKH